MLYNHSTVDKEPFKKAPNYQDIYAHEECM